MPKSFVHTLHKCHAVKFMNMFVPFGNVVVRTFDTSLRDSALSKEVGWCKETVGCVCMQGLGHLPRYMSFNWKQVNLLVT